MKLPLQSAASRGFTLIECLVYMSVLAIVLGLGTAAFYQCWDDNKSITRNGNDIVRTLKVGETWRDDLRAATGPIQLTTTNSEQTILIPCGNKKLIYAFANGEVRKQIDANSPWQVVLPKVKSSQMQIDKRQNVIAYRWEVELEATRKNIHTRPLFTFEVVPGNSAIQ